MAEMWHGANGATLCQREMLRWSWRRLCWTAVAAGCLVGCDLNPQPEPPGDTGNPGNGGPSAIPDGGGSGFDVGAVGGSNEYSNGGGVPVCCAAEGGAAATGGAQTSGGWAAAATGGTALGGSATAPAGGTAAPGQGIGGLTPTGGFDTAGSDTGGAASDLLGGCANDGGLRDSIDASSPAAACPNTVGGNAP